MFQNLDLMQKIFLQGWIGWICLELIKIQSRSRDIRFRTGLLLVLGRRTLDCFGRGKINKKELWASHPLSLIEDQSLKAMEKISQKRKLYLINKLFFFVYKGGSLYRHPKPLHWIKPLGRLKHSWKLLVVDLASLGRSWDGLKVFILGRTPWMCQNSVGTQESYYIWDSIHSYSLFLLSPISLH